MADNPIPASQADEEPTEATLKINPVLSPEIARLIATRPQPEPAGAATLAPATAPPVAEPLKKDIPVRPPITAPGVPFLSHTDFIVRRKAVKVIKDPDTGETVTKANVDTELILDLINTADNYDLAFLFSGDSDFERAVDLLRSRGKRVYVVTSKQVGSRELFYVADKPIFFLEDFKAELQREDRTMA